MPIFSFIRSYLLIQHRRLTTSETGNRFQILDESELKQLEESVTKSESTNSVIRGSVRTLRDFMKSRGDEVPEDFSNMSVDDLDELLRSFYAGLRTNGGNLYKANSFKSIKYGLQRYFKSERQLDIFNDLRFESSKQMYCAVMADLKKKGMNVIDHHPPVNSADFSILYASCDRATDKGNYVFDHSTPNGLLQKVWFEVSLFLCKKGRENFRSMKKSTFAIGVDLLTGRDYVYNAIDEFEDEDDMRRMFSIPENPHCPVLTFRKYLDHLHPDLEDFWQTPKQLLNFSDEGWFKRVPLGKNYLGTMMSRISNQAGLSKVYNNHSLRATSNAIQDLQGFVERHIIDVTGHTSELSLKQEPPDED